MNIKFLNENATVPTRGSAEAAGWDLYNAGPDVIIPAEQTVKVGTGIAIELPEGTFGGVFPRSGLATKHGLAPANKVGVVDSDYRGEVIVALHNHSTNDVGITHGERIAQLIVIPYMSVDMNVVDELSDTDRGEGGFGSTGTN